MASNAEQPSRRASAASEAAANVHAPALASTSRATSPTAATQAAAPAATPSAAPAAPPAPLQAHVPVTRSTRRRKKRKPSLRSQIWVALSKHFCKATCVFFDAVQSGQVEEVQRIAEANPRMLLRTKPGTMWTAAHLAAEQGDFQMTMVLFDVAERLDRAARDGGAALPTFVSCVPRAAAAASASRSSRLMLNACTEKNLTPLMLACKRGHPATASFLMSKGSNPLTSDREGAKMAIHYAALYGHWSCVQVLLDRRWQVHGAHGEEPLAMATVQDAHGHRKYIDVRTCAGLTPLHMAAWAGHTEVAKILLQHGALMSPRTVHSSPSTSSVLPGSTPIHLAARKNRIQVVKVILLAYLDRVRQQEEAGVQLGEREVDPRTICDDHGNYPVMHAVARGNNNMAALLDTGASLELLLVNDGGQLGQLPRLTTLAMGALRLRLLRELDLVVSALPRASLKEVDQLSDSDIATPTSKRGAANAMGRPTTAHLTDLRLCDITPAPDVDLELAVGRAGAVCDSLHNASQRTQASRDHSNLRAVSFTSYLDNDSACASEDDNLCSICMENPASIELTKCEHTMCAPCARKLLLLGTSSACQCPFCRTYIAAFGPSRPSATKAL